MSIRFSSPLTIKVDSSSQVASILTTDTDPSPGLPSTLGSLVLSEIGGRGHLYIKDSAPDSGWHDTGLFSVYTADGSITGNRDVSAAVDGSGDLLVESFELIELINASVIDADGGIYIQWFSESGLIITDISTSPPLFLQGEVRLTNYEPARDDTASYPVEAFPYTIDGGAGQTDLKSTPRNNLYPAGPFTAPTGPFTAPLWLGQLCVGTSSTPPQIMAYDGVDWPLTN